MVARYPSHDSNMKFYVVLLFFVAFPAALASFSADIEIPLRKYEEDCSTETGLDYAQIEIIRKSRMVPDDEKANQWAKCMMQKHNVIKSDGTVNMDIDKITIPADTDTVIRAFPICKVLVGRDIADTARLMMNCYLSKSDGLVMGIYSHLRTSTIHVV